MKNTSPESEDSASQEKTAASNVRYVEELASAEDAWVSITDAARITRSSEAMARRWVSSGRLPVKRQPVGINQQTRLVRLSDVALIRPIIDPTAAISDEVHTLDLPSIPRQQAQMVQDHQRLLHQLQEAEAQVETLSEQVRTQTQALEQVKQTLEEQEKNLQGDLKRHQKEFADHLQKAEVALHQMLQEKEDTLAQRQQQMEEAYHDFVTAQRHQNELVHATLEHVQGTLGRQQQELAHLQQSLKKYYQGAATYREEVMRSVEQQFQEMKVVFEQAIAEYQQQITRWEEDSKQRARHFERVERELREGQRRLTLQDQHIHWLTRNLQDERDARKKDALTVLALQKQLQVVQREVEDIKRRMLKPSSDGDGR